MQINIASGNATIYVSQENSYKKNLTKKEELERNLRVFKRHLKRFNVDEQTKRDFEQEIHDIEQELASLE